MSASAPAEDLDEARYGRRPRGRGRSRRFWWAVAAVGVVVGVGWAAWASTWGSPAVAGQVVGYEVTSPNETRVDLVLERRDGDAAVCEVYAVAQDHAIVGERTLEVPAGEPGSVRVGAEVRTERRAVTGTLRSCRVAG